MTPDEQLSLAIGSIVRMDVEMEGSLQHTWVQMVGGQGFAVAPVGFSNLRDQVKALVEWVEMPEHHRAAALSALAEAKRVHELRNRYVHDRWLPSFDHVDPTAPPKLTRVKVSGLRAAQQKATPMTLGELEKVRDEVARAMTRVQFLFWIVPHAPPAPPEFPGEAENRERMVEIVAGRFDLLSDGGVRPHSFGSGDD